METIGQLLLKERIKRGWNQSYLAAHFGVDQSRVSRWEKDTSTPTREYWPPLCKFLKINETQLHEALYSSENLRLRRKWL